MLVCFMLVNGQTDTVKNYTDINGMKQGFWVKYDKTGRKVFEGYFKNDEPYGEMKRYHKNGQVKAVMTFDTKDQKRVGVVYFDDTGEKSATGGFYDKKREGNWQYFGVGAKLVGEENYTKGQKHGVSKKYYPSGKVVEEIHYKEGKLDGAWLRYYESGILRMKMQHEKDVRGGDFFSYFGNGKVEIQGQYLDDKKVGTWKKYDEKGKVIKEMKFIDGKLENEDEVDRQFAKEMEEAEKNKGKFADPEDELKKDVHRGGYGGE